MADLTYACIACKKLYPHRPTDEEVKEHMAEAGCQARQRELEEAYARTKAERASDASADDDKDEAGPVMFDITLTPGGTTVTAGEGCRDAEARRFIQRAAASLQAATGRSGDGCWARVHRGGEAERVLRAAFPEAEERGVEGAPGYVEIRVSGRDVARTMRAASMTANERVYPPGMWDGLSEPPRLLEVQPLTNPGHVHYLDVIQERAEKQRAALAAGGGAGEPPDPVEGIFPPQEGPLVARAGTCGCGRPLLIARDGSVMHTAEDEDHHLAFWSGRGPEVIAVAMDLVHRGPPGEMRPLGTAPLPVPEPMPLAPWVKRAPAETPEWVRKGLAAMTGPPLDAHLYPGGGIADAPRSLGMIFYLDAVKERAQRRAAGETGPGASELGTDRPEDTYCARCDVFGHAEGSPACEKERSDG